MSGKDTIVVLPMTFTCELLNLTDHTLVIELEASKSENCELEMRAVLNLNTFDELVTFSPDDDGSCHKTVQFTVPVIKLNLENRLSLFISSDKADALFKLSKVELSLISRQQI